MESPTNLETPPGNCPSGILSRYWRWVFRARRKRCVGLLAAFVAILMLVGIACQLHYSFDVKFSVRSRREFEDASSSNQIFIASNNHSEYRRKVTVNISRSIVSLPLTSESREEDFGEEIEDIVRLQVDIGGPGGQKGLYQPHSLHVETPTEHEPNVVVYNMYQDPGGRFPCVNIELNPSVLVCLYQEGEDLRVSDVIREKGKYQPFIVDIFIRALNDDPDLGLIDIGANLGQFSIIAASRKRDVMAIEPHIQHLRRFNKAVYMKNLQRRLTVLQNVISDKRGMASMFVSKEQPGHAEPLDILKKDYTTPRVEVVTLDDIVPYARFKSAIIMIDSESQPHRIFVQSEKLFAKIDVQFVFMNWKRIRFFLENKFKVQVEIVERMVELLQRHGLDPYDPRGMKGLLLTNLTEWPDNIMWMKKTSKLLQQSLAYRFPKAQPRKISDD